METEYKCTRKELYELMLLWVTNTPTQEELDRYNALSAEEKARECTDYILCGLEII